MTETGNRASPGTPRTLCKGDQGRYFDRWRCGVPCSAAVGGVLSLDGMNSFWNTRLAREMPTQFARLQSLVHRVAVGDPAGRGRDAAFWELILPGRPAFT
jgi:hypothetical protein